MRGAAARLPSLSLSGLHSSTHQTLLASTYNLPCLILIQPCCIGFYKLLHTFYFNTVSNQTIPRQLQEIYCDLNCRTLRTESVAVCCSGWNNLCQKQPAFFRFTLVGSHSIACFEIWWEKNWRMLSKLFSTCVQHSVLISDMMKNLHIHFLDLSE